MTKWIGSAVLLLSAISAAADRPERSGPAMGVVAVAEPPAGPSQELTELTTSLRASVSQRSPGVLSPQDLRQRMLTRSPSASLSELDRAYAGAVAAHQSGDFEGAVRSLSAVLTDLERMPDGPETFSQWSRALLRLARAQGSLGRKADAEESMKRLLRADPTANADPELYPPSFQRQLEEARKQLAAAPKHKLVVKGPKGAKVFVEGREVADAPATLSLAPGKYRVTGAQKGVRVTSGVYDLSTEDQVATLDFSLVEMFRPEAGPGLAAPVADRAKAIVTAGASLQLDQVLAATIATDGDVRFLVGTLYDVRRGMVVREGRLRLQGSTVPDGGLGALSGFLLSGESSSLVISGGESRPVSAPEGVVKVSARPTQKGGNGEVLGWTAVGTGAVTLGLVGVAAFEGFAAQGNYNKAFALRDPATGGLTAGTTPDTYDALVVQGNGQRSVALVTGVGAGAALITTAALSFLAYQQSGSVGPFRF